MSKKIAVLMGGWSSEREVSLVGGRSCAQALRDKGHEVTEIDLKRDLHDLLDKLSFKPDVVYNALHGKFGEDGCIQGVLEILGIPYTHSGPLASALAMNKQKTKEILEPLGMPCAEGALMDIEDVKKGKIPFKPPYVIKPNEDGSSVGIYIVREGDNKPLLGLDEWTYGPHALVEKYIPGRELTVAVMGTKKEKARALTVTEITTGLDFYNYEAKYASGGSRHIVPAPIDKGVFDAAMRLAVLAHEKLGCTGVTRTDFRYNDQEPGAGGLFYLETNTQPGMTPTSLVPEQASYLGMKFGDLVEWLVDNAAVHS